MSQARNKASRDRIAGTGHHDRGIPGSLLGSQRRGITSRDDDIDVLGNEVVYEAGKAVELALRGATL